MATGGGTFSISRTSDEIFEFECSKCSDNGKRVEAEVFCVECGNNMCRKCLKNHNDFPQLRAHHIKKTSAVKFGKVRAAPRPPSEKCSEHDGRLIDTFCSRHDVVGCSVCVSENHRSCPDVSYLPKVASGISTSKELQDTQTSAKQLKQRLDKLKEKQHNSLEKIKRQKIEALERAAMYKDELIESIEKLGKKTASEIIDTYKDLEETIGSDLDELSKLIQTLDDMDSNLMRFTDDETKLFVHLKMCKQYLSAGEKLAKTCFSAFGTDRCTFNADRSIDTYLRYLTKLGSFTMDIKAVHSFDQNIKNTADETACRITGMCSLETGELMLTDNTNHSLKRLEMSFQIKDQCALPSKPWDVCRTSPTEVAVTMWKDNTIQFVSVSRVLSLTRSFTLHESGYCNGIACSGGKLYVARQIVSYSFFRGSASVQVYDINGTLLQTIDKDTAGTPIFRDPLHITFSATKMYVTDYNAGIIILDKSGQLIATATDPELNGAYGLCVLPEEHLLICGRDSHNIIQFDAQGKKMRTLLTAADGLNKPETLHFYPGKLRCVLANRCSNYVKVYDIVHK